MALTPCTHMALSLASHSPSKKLSSLARKLQTLMLSMFHAFRLVSFHYVKLSCLLLSSSTYVLVMAILVAPWICLGPMKQCHYLCNVFHTHALVINVWFHLQLLSSPNQFKHK